MQFVCQTKNDADLDTLAFIFYFFDNYTVAFIVKPSPNFNLY